MWVSRLCDAPHRRTGARLLEVALVVGKSQFRDDSKQSPRSAQCRPPHHRPQAAQAGGWWGNCAATHLHGGNSRDGRFGGVPPSMYNVYCCGHWGKSSNATLINNTTDTFVKKSKYIGILCQPICVSFACLSTRSESSVMQGKGRFDRFNLENIKR